MQANSDSLKRVALRAAALVLVLPTVVVMVLFRDHLAGKELTLILILAVAALGFYLLWSIIKAMTDLQSGLSKFARGESTSLEVKEGPTQLREMTSIIEALNKLTIEFRENGAQLERFIQQFASLTELTDVTAKVPDIDELLSLVLGKALTGVRAQRGAVMLLSDDRKYLEVVATEGWSTTLDRILELGRAFQTFSLHLCRARAPRHEYPPL